MLNFINIVWFVRLFTTNVFQELYTEYQKDLKVWQFIELN